MAHHHPRRGIVAGLIAVTPGLAALPACSGNEVHRADQGADPRERCVEVLSRSVVFDRGPSTANAQAACRELEAVQSERVGAGGPEVEPGSSVVAVLPDTQYYSLDAPEVFLAQTSWIASNATALGIRLVLHLGDVVNNNTEVEWARATQALRVLEGRVALAIAPGNHDYGPTGAATTRVSPLNSHLSFARAQAEESFGGAFEAGKLDNTYHLIDLGGRPYVVLALEWGPRDAVVAWANQVMEAHAERLGILVTHAFLNEDGQRFDHRARDRNERANPHDYPTPGGVTDGEELWHRLVRKHRFVMTLNGHALGDGVGYLVSRTAPGNQCHQMLSNYQTRPLGGEGYLRLLEFLPGGRRVVVHTYSPVRDQSLRDPDHEFAFEVDQD